MHFTGGIWYNQLFYPRGLMKRFFAPNAEITRLVLLGGSLAKPAVLSWEFNIGVGW